MRASSIVLCVVPLLQPAAAQPPPQSANAPEITVTGHVTPHCRSLPDDPRDIVTAQAPKGRWVWIVPASRNPGYKYASSLAFGAASMTPPGQWRRAGDALPTYVFRQPADGTPACIGKRRRHPLPDDRDGDPSDEIVVTAKVQSPQTGGQLQQQIDSALYLCRSVRLTINVATRGATAWLWLNAGHGQPKFHAIDGTDSWITIRMEDGPVGWWYPWVGFGIVLAHGDAWVDQAKFELIPDETLNDDQRAAEQACQAHLSKKQRAAQNLS